MRRKMVDRNSRLSIRNQSKLLQVNRSGLYVSPKGESVLNLELMALMDAHRLKHPTKGVLQMQDFLRGKGFSVNVKRVRRLVRLMGIEAIYPKRNLSKLGLAKYIRPYLLRGLTVDRPNQVWAIDITYIPMRRGFMYLTAVIDLYSRFIVGWQLSNTLEAETQTELINDLVADGARPDIINSDQGSQYTSAIWTQTLDDHKIRISMDGKGRATDNAFIERFFRTIKQEYIYLNPSESVCELREGIKTFIEYYNFERTHQGIGRVVPAKKYGLAAPGNFSKEPLFGEGSSEKPPGFDQNQKEKIISTKKSQLVA